jgi:pyruvate kinase
MPTSSDRSMPGRLTLDLSRVDLARRRTKIVATIGPASWEPDVLDELVEAGVNVFRLNMSHGDHATHERSHRRIRAAARKAGKHVAVLADLCGPKIRVGKFEDGAIELEDGADVVVTTRSVVGKPGLIPSQYGAFAKDVKKGDRVLLNDGNIELRVLSVKAGDVRCRVVHGGPLSDHKGMNLPGVNVSAPSLTKKDRADARFAIGLGVDYLALSFVRKGADVRGLKRLVANEGGFTPVIAKIEMREALERIDEILETADGVMVARGDLGVEVPVEEVPLIQKELVRLSVEANRPVIMATQMLESMVDSARPTRAEVTDVANAALTGADAVMLSAETAAGKHPVEAVKTMDRVLRMIEGYQWKHGQFGGLLDHGLDAVEGAAPLSVPEALSRATSLLSRGLAVRSVVVPTETGRTARWVSSERPAAPVLAVSHHTETVRRTALYWGATPVLVTPLEMRDSPSLARNVVQRLGLAKKGDPLLLVWDSSADHDGSQPTITVLRM